MTVILPGQLVGLSNVEESMLSGHAFWGNIWLFLCWVVYQQSGTLGGQT